MFEKLLIANRGEIACRIAATARRMGLRTVAVYSAADAGARHVRLADEAYPIGPAPAGESYLVIERLLDVARRSGAEAVHPGYGFLAENADFAAAVAEAGLVFVGPPPEAIRAMGSKSEAKEIAGRAGVPLVPGYHGRAQTPRALAKAAERIGYPVLLKASAGGGGKGMRVVESPGDLEDAIASAKRESAAAFGDDRLLIERYLARPRHVELQIFADSRGNFVHLFERDCSIQRRHQKVVEEAPAPGLSDDRRREMAAAAEALVRAIGYVGAGTVEFIVDEDGAFYFMEMNTRLQVEHPVTEMITGLDLVEWQLRVAAGEPLPRTQEEIAVDGHAIEVRLYAEDPSRDFLPAAGRLFHLRFPEEGPHLRIDTGVVAGDEIGIHYDPLIAKIIVWDRDRDGAVRHLRSALARTEVAGTVTNLAFLAAVSGHPDFAAARIDTGFVARHRDALVPPPAPAPDTVLALAALRLLLDRNARARAAAAASADPYSPWHRTDGWRLNDDHYTMARLIDGERRVAFRIHFRSEGYVMDLPGGPATVSGALEDAETVAAELDGVRVRAPAVLEGRTVTVLLDGREYRLAVDDPAAAAEEAGDAAAARVIAPMPGRIIEVRVAAGDTVSRGDPLVVMEAMKMEHVIVAPAGGRIARVRHGTGEQVDEGAELIAFEAPDEAGEGA